MKEVNKYDFRPATLSDLETLSDWQRQPHVCQWWDAAPKYDRGDLADPRVARWMVSTSGKSFAYMQDYDVHGWPNHHFAYLPQGSRGIDQFIGLADMIERGHGTAFIAQRIKSLFISGVPVIATDPHPDNARAIAAYKKLGFSVVGDSQTTEWGLILPMEARKK